MAFGIRDLLATAVNPSTIPMAGGMPPRLAGKVQSRPQNPISFAGEPVQPQLPVGQIRQTPQPVRPMSRQELMQMLFSNYQNRSMEGFNPKSRGFNSINTRFRQ